MPRQQILILGGGYAAGKIAKGLRKAVKHGEVDATFVSRHNYYVFHGFLGEMVTGRIGAEQILSPLRRVFAPARMHVGEVDSIDLDRKRVVVSRHLDGQQQELSYDQLVLALGTTDNLTLYPGLAEHAFRLKAYDDGFRVKNHILTMFELADIESNAEERRSLLTFVIAGGGFAGSEVAGELADFVRLLTLREYNRIRPEDCRVVLVQPGDHILPELHTGPGAAGYGHGHPRLVEKAMRHMLELGVDVRLNSTVAWVSSVEVGFADGSRLPTRTVISAVGTRPQPILDTLPLPRDARGRVIVDACMRVPGFDNVWATGDCAAVPHPNGGTCPPTGLWALKGGGHTAENLLRVARGEEPVPFRFRGIGQVVSIGRRTAVGEFKGIELTGKLPWLIWRAVLFYLVPTWDRRLRLLSDWILWPIVGRDVVEMDVTDSNRYRIEQELFEPGEVVVAEGQVCPFLYVIVDGQAESARTRMDGTKDVRQLAAGDHFGRRGRGGTSQETVVARTQLQTVTLRADHGERLDLLAALGRAAEQEEAAEVVAS
jgi:NADH dehydrogenase